MLQRNLLPIRSSGLDFRVKQIFATPTETLNPLANPSYGRNPAAAELFPTRPEESDEEVLTDESIQTRLQNLLPKGSPYATVHRTLYKVHQRVAKEFRRGRVILAGDAAHINNPLGGMGMNGGVQDAFNLSDKLVEILVSGASPDLLDRYERQRRSVAIEYINANTARNKKTIEERDPEARHRSRPISREGLPSQNIHD